MEIDYSAITPAPASKATGWKPPRHVYFGPKDPDTGELASEPVYTFQEFPKMLYKQADGKLSASIANNQAEFDAMTADGCKESPAEFGIVTAPSYEQSIAVPPRRGRPPKADA